SLRRCGVRRPHLDRVVAPDEGLWGSERWLSPRDVFRHEFANLRNPAQAYVSLPPKSRMVPRVLAWDLRGATRGLGGVDQRGSESQQTCRRYTALTPHMV